MNQVFFENHEDLVIRIVGNLLLLVNIKDNSIFEIDEISKNYIEYAQKNNGLIDLDFFSKMNNNSIESISKEVAILLKTIN